MHPQAPPISFLVVNENNHIVLYCNYKPLMALKDHITMTYRLLSADSLTGSVKIMKFGSSKTAFSFQDPFLII
ncbi:MAG: hypothetical protein EZS28_047465, partial [Streblomastix strix]